jgi:phosphopantothenate---cysteine ligase (CTP)
MSDDEFQGVFISYRTYEDLERFLRTEVISGGYDAVIHSAAVSDYYVSQVLQGDLTPIDNSGKVGSNHDKLYLELKPTAKLIDNIRRPWGFKGVLVKFKLQVGMTDEELLKIATASRVASDADIIVANCLEWARERAYIVGEHTTKRVARKVLASELLNDIVAKHNYCLAKSMGLT